MNSKRLQSRFIRRKLTLHSVVFRFLALVYIVYSIFLIDVARFMTGNIFEGVYWINTGPGSLFPIPSRPGWIPALSPANLIDALIFSILIQTGLWLVLLVLAVLYILSPVTISRNETEKPESAI